MRAAIALAVVCLLLIGCMNSYRVTEADDRFSTGTTHGTFAHGCRVSSKSIAGGTHLDDNGLYISPAIFRDKVSGEVKGAGFSIENIYDSSSLYGTPNALGVITSAVFNVDGEVIPLQIDAASGAQSRGGSSYNTVDKSVSAGMQEQAGATLPVDKLEKIIRGKVIILRVVGSRGSVTYEDSDISRSYRENLARFGTEVMKLEGIALPPPPEPRKAGKG